jgi:NADPH:quinone reductase
VKAIVVHSFGAAETLAIDETAEPTPLPGEVTIDVAYAGVGFVDTLMRAGRFDFIKLPFIPGIEVSGHLRAAGEGVTGLRPGQSVAALLTDFTAGGMSGYAEVARAKAALTIPLEPEDDLATAAATMVNGATAFMAMDGIKAGNAVIISGASGGLGRCLIAAAIAMKAGTIVAVSGSPARQASLRSAGATAVIAPEEMKTQTAAFDAAFDTVGGELRRNLMASLKPSGRLVLLGNASGNDTALPGDNIWLRQLRVEGLSTGASSPEMPERIASAARAALTVARREAPPFEVVDLADAREAHAALEGRRGPGKFVLRI